MTPPFSIKKYLLVVSLCLLCIANSSGNDLLDVVKSNTTQSKDLKDIYRVFVINHQVDEQKEFINLYLNQHPEKLRAAITGYIKVCETLKSTPFYNDTLKNYVNRFLAQTVQSYQIASKGGFNSKAFKQDYKTYSKEKDRYLDYIGRAYSMQRFVDLSEQKYWQLNDKKNYIKSAGYATYQKLRPSNLKAALAGLEKTSAQTTNFQEYSIYQIEIADQYVKHPDALGGNATETAIKMYRDILDKKKFSIYLFEAWLKWRAVYQQNNGLSKSSDIPNDKYNQFREQDALTILNYITANPTDKMAINEFLLIATHDIVKRFGDYPYGNQNTVEYHDLFDDKK